MSFLLRLHHLHHLHPLHHLLHHHPLLPSHPQHRVSRPQSTTRHSNLLKTKHFPSNLLFLLFFHSKTSIIRAMHVQQSRDCMLWMLPTISKGFTRQYRITCPTCCSQSSTSLQTLKDLTLLTSSTLLICVFLLPTCSRLVDKNVQESSWMLCSRM